MRVYPLGCFELYTEKFATVGLNSRPALALFDQLCRSFPCKRNDGDLWACCPAVLGIFAIISYEKSPCTKLSLQKIGNLDEIVKQL